MTKPTENELRLDRIRAHAKAIFDGVSARFLFRVSLLDEPTFPELEIPANDRPQSCERYNAACSIRWANKPHNCEVIEPAAAPEPLDETPAPE